jgi:hypothetical protein
VLSALIAGRRDDGVMTTDLQTTLARLDRIRPHPPGVIDLERVRLKRELAALRARLSDSEWQVFLREYANAVAGRVQCGRDEVGCAEADDEHGEREPVG